MRIQLAPALVLHRRPWRDTSLLVEAFARDHGRIGLIARGARRPKSRWRGLIEPLSQLDLSWSGRGELYTLTELEAGNRHALAGNALMGGLYASELVMRLTARDDPHPQIYDSLLGLLQTLIDGAPAVVALRFFERDLLDELGYGVPIDITSDDGEPVAATTDYVYDSEHGLMRRRAAPSSNQVGISGAALIGLATGRFADRAGVHEARRLMRAALAAHLGPTPLRSVQTLKAMQQFSAANANDGSADQEQDIHRQPR